ncbi:hypothetical protein B0A48_04647 [Cryoendolithus antarcticus]|uniref:Uncharacterized protein n=1 Tax=Cryoendolithus antarcticus TaxID=1507870 RepID=A0A1V8TFX5_9PEZI|nr:hypothetical protein B0A48_04647 [Cryoendolithus antarcticus]
MAGTPPQFPPPTPKATSSFPTTTSPIVSPRDIQGDGESARVVIIMAALRAERTLASRDSIATVLADEPSSETLTDQMTQARVKAESSAWKAAAPTPHDEEAAWVDVAIAKNALAIAEAQASLAAVLKDPDPLNRHDRAELTLQNHWEAAYRAREDALENSLERTQTLLEALAESRPSSSGSDEKKWEEVERPKVLVNGRKWQENGGKEAKGVVGKAGETLKGLFGRR